MNYDKELNISEENIGKIIKYALNEDNIDLIGNEANNYIEYVNAIFSKEYDLSEKALRDLSDCCVDLAQMASSYSFQKGFKEGVRIFRTLMHL